MKKIFFVSIVFCFLAGFYVFAWQEPAQNPPSGNVDTPINTGNIGQEKSGGLILNTGGAETGLIVQEGSVGIGVTIPTQKLDINGKVKVNNSVVYNPKANEPSTWAAGSTGELAYSTTKGTFYYYNGTAWATFASSGSSTGTVKIFRFNGTNTYRPTVNCGTGWVITQCGPGEGQTANIASVIADMNFLGAANPGIACTQFTGGGVIGLSSANIEIGGASGYSYRSFVVKCEQVAN